MNDKNFQKVRRSMRANIQLVLLLPLLAMGSSRADGIEPNREFPEWAFCIAYTMRDADERDARPLDPAIGDLFGDGATEIPT